MERIPIELHIIRIHMAVPCRHSPHRSQRSGSSHHSGVNPLAFSIEWVFPPGTPCFRFQQEPSPRFPNARMVQDEKVHSGEYGAAISLEIEEKDAHRSLLACNRDIKMARME